MNSAEAVAVQTDRKIVIAGWSSPVSGALTEFTLWRLEPDGAPDLEFGTAGRIIPFADGPADDAGAYDVVIDPEGRIVAVGAAAEADGEGGVAVARYLPNGTPDPAFGGGDGTVVLGGRERFAGCTGAGALAQQADGKLVVVRVRTDAGGEAGGVEVLAVRLDASGALDPSFARDGIRTFDFGRCRDSDSRCGPGGWPRADLGCGRRVLRGNQPVTRRPPQRRRNLRHQLRAQRTPAYRLRLPGNRALAMTLDARERIVLAGSARPEHGPDRFALARLRADGALDRRFGVRGIVTTEIARGRDAIASSVLPLAAEELLLGGGLYAKSGDSAGFTVAAFTSRGALKRSFGDGGVRTVRFPDRASAAAALAGDPDGRIVAVGQTGTRAAVARLRAR